MTDGRGGMKDKGLYRLSSSRTVISKQERSNGLLGYDGLNPNKPDPKGGRNDRQEENSS